MPYGWMQGPSILSKVKKLTGGKAVKASQAISNLGAKHANSEARTVFGVVDADGDAEFIFVRRMGKKPDEARAQQL